MSDEAEETIAAVLCILALAIVAAAVLIRWPF